jgi:hypothetical protein
LLGSKNGNISFFNRAEEDYRERRQEERTGQGCKDRSKLGVWRSEVVSAPACRASILSRATSEDSLLNYSYEDNIEIRPTMPNPEPEFINV